MNCDKTDIILFIILGVCIGMLLGMLFIITATRQIKTQSGLYYIGNKIKDGVIFNGFIDNHTIVIAIYEGGEYVNTFIDISNTKSFRLGDYVYIIIEYGNDYIHLYYEGI